jgi:hypothetical protein
MTEDDREKNAQERIGKLLRDAYGDSDDGPGLQRDLWPAMLRRMESPAMHVPWYDWALAAVSLAALAMLPGFLMVLAYHI